jgi:hypothetical protein
MNATTLLVAATQSQRFLPACFQPVSSKCLTGADGTSVKYEPRTAGGWSVSISLAGGGGIPNVLMNDDELRDFLKALGHQPKPASQPGNP